MLQALGFCMSKSFESSSAPSACNATTTSTSIVTTPSMFTKNVYCDVISWGQLQLLHHIGAYKHYSFWSINKVVPALIWLNISQEYSIEYTCIDKDIFICNNQLYSKLQIFPNS